MGWVTTKRLSVSFNNSIADHNTAAQHQNISAISAQSARANRRDGSPLRNRHGDEGDSPRARREPDAAPRKHVDEEKRVCTRRKGR